MSNLEYVEKLLNSTGKLTRCDYEKLSKFTMVTLVEHQLQAQIRQQFKSRPWVCCIDGRFRVPKECVVVETLGDQRMFTGHIESLPS